MPQNETTISVVDLIEAKALKIGLITNLIAIAFVLFFGAILYIWFHYERVDVLLKSSEKSISQSVLLGDKIHIANQFESLVNSESLSGVWLFDFQSQSLINGNSKDNFKILFDTKLPFFFIDHSTPTIFIEKEVRTTSGEVVAVIKAILRISTRLYLAFIIFLLIVFLSANLFLMKEFKKIGLAIAEPISFFSTAISRQNTLGDNLSRPKTQLYTEIAEVYSGYFQLIEKLKVSEHLEKDAAIGRITAHLSHDLRAPLGAIERLLMGPEISLSNLRFAVRDPLNRLNSMIESLRYAEIENLVKRTSFYLSFHGLYEALKYKAELSKLTIILPEKDFDDLWLDGPKVERALINLLSNSIEVAKTYVSVKGEARGNSLYLRVIDDGPGVPDIILPSLFQRGVTSGKMGGTGLGLAYVKQVMQGHGGDVFYIREQNTTIFECFISHAIYKNTAAPPIGMKTIEHSERIEIKQVSVCFVPAHHGETIRQLLININDPRFRFVHFYSADSKIVITNIDDLSIKGLEEGLEVIEIKKTLSEHEIVERLQSRLGLRG